MHRGVNPHWVVEITNPKGKPIEHILCSSKGAAEQAMTESKRNDPFGWFSDYAIKPLTSSELAYLIAA